MPRGRTHIFRRSREPTTHDFALDLPEQPLNSSICPPFLTGQAHPANATEHHVVQRHHDSRVLYDHQARLPSLISPHPTPQPSPNFLYTDAYITEPRTYQQSNEDFPRGSQPKTGPLIGRPRARVVPSQDFFKWTRRRREVLRRQEAADAAEAAAAAQAAAAAAATASYTARSGARRHHQSHRPLYPEEDSEESGSGGHSSRSPRRNVPSGAGSSSTGDARDDSPSSIGLAPLRYSNADLHLSGWLMKRGKRLGSRVDRFVELNGSLLTNARSEGARPTWCVNLRGSKILSGPNREIVFKVDNSFFSFYAPSDEIHAMWLEALQSVSMTVTNFYDFGKLIGKGAYSEVFLARDQQRNELCAVKVLERRSREYAKLIDRELKVLRMLHSTSLVRTYDIFDTPSDTYVVMEYLAGGELLEIIQDNDHLSERNAKHVLRQVLEAILYLHDKGIVHRDVKPENILCVNRSFPLRVKLTDFGLSRVISSADPSAPDMTMRSQCGTAYYLAPEIANNLSYGKPVDLWACGVVGYVMLAGKFPFYGDVNEIMRRLRGGVKFPEKEWRSVSQNAKSLLRGLLDPNPETRLTAKQALEHRWLHEDCDTLAQSSKPHMLVGGARTLGELQLAAKNESLSLQLMTFAPSKERRRRLLDNGVGIAEEDMILRTEEFSRQYGNGDDTNGNEVFHYAEESDEDIPTPGNVHIDPPLATLCLRAAEV